MDAVQPCGALTRQEPQDRELLCGVSERVRGTVKAGTLLSTLQTPQILHI